MVVSELKFGTLRFSALNKPENSLHPNKTKIIFVLSLSKKSRYDIQIMPYCIATVFDVLKSYVMITIKLYSI